MHERVSRPTPARGKEDKLHRYLVTAFAFLFAWTHTLDAAAAGDMYVEVSPGLSMISDSDTSGGFFASPDIEYDRGFTIGGALGYQIQDQVRAEASLSYRTADVDQVGGISAGASGDVNVTSLMANVYYDFDLGLPVTPYLGAGLGLARVDLDAKLGGVSAKDDDDTAFSFSLMAGAAYRISDNLDLSLGYRYLGARAVFDGNLNVSEILFGVRYRF